MIYCRYMIQRLVIVHELGQGLQVDQRGQLINLLNEGEDAEMLVLEHVPPALVGCEVCVIADEEPPGNRAQIFKLLRSLGIDSTQSIPPTYLA